MNEDGVLDICDALSLRSGPAYAGGDKWGPHMSISCPLACLNHGDSYDWNTSCSISISEDEPSMAKCFSFNCGYSGSFYTMLVQAIKARGNTEQLIALLKNIEPTEKLTLESSIARSKKRFDSLIAKARHPVLATRDRDILPEARLQRFRSCVPRYAVTRGLTIETCNAWELGYDKKNKRLVFPVRRHDGNLIGLTGRVIQSELDRLEAAGTPIAKYHNYAGLDKSQYLFGEHMIKRGEPVVIVEGQIDAILVWQYLGLSAVAPLGEGFSRTHVRTICSFEPPVVYLFPDNDAAGKLAAEKFEYALHGRVPLKLMLPPELMDPGDMNKLEMEDAKAASRPIMGKIRWS